MNITMVYNYILIHLVDDYPLINLFDVMEMIKKNDADFDLMRHKAKKTIIGSNKTKDENF